MRARVSEVPSPQFSVGDRVVLLSDRSKVGQVVAEPIRSYGSFWYRVELINGSEETFPEEDLAPFRAGVGPDGLFRQRSFGDHDDFRRTVTFQKLDVPLDNTLYALRASRTEFYPHQYKPLVKFLDSKDQRLLIADEVGLGKTIEAGIILTEQRARNEIKQALVVCPAALCLKWREEMWRRFEEEFEILNSAGFQHLLEDLNRRGHLGEFRHIISLQSLRQRRYIDRLEAGPLPLDLLIVDEAHHCRNPSTNSHRVVSALTEASSAVLLLTATPIHLGTENLFHLFRLLDPAEFDDIDTFDERLLANAPIVEAQRLLLRSFPPPLEEVRERIEKLGSRGYSRYFEGNQILERVEQKLNRLGRPTRSDVAVLQQDMEHLNLLAHIFSRTRKREVFEKPPVRDPWVERPSMTPQEREFYSAVTEFVRETMQSRTGAVRYFGIMAAQRQVASCMQACIQKFSERAELVYAEAEPEQSDLEGWEDETVESVPVPPSERVIRAASALGSVDTKYDALKRVLDALDRVESGRKVILFSYYKNTLRYLQKRLVEDGVRCVMIHGDVRSDHGNPDRDERGRRMKQFRDSEEVQLLLSSEVSSEGLDFQFCHILINYDLPWNPMRVEQRIGRLDRLGQESDRIIIVNFSIPDTIEDRILTRLYERIGIFRESIGDLEAILGDEIRKLTLDLLSRHLTPKEEERRIEQAAQVIQTRQQELKRLEGESSRFVGHDAYFREELERIEQGGEFLTPEDCRVFFRGYLEHFSPRSSLEPDRKDGVFHLRVGQDLEGALRRQPDDLAKRRFLQRLGRGEIRVTFDSKVAFEDEDLEFLRPHHSLMRVAVDGFRENPESVHPVSRVRVRNAEHAPPGRYCYALFRVTIRGGRERRRLEPFFIPLDGPRASGGPLSAVDSSLLLGEMLRQRHGDPDLDAYGPLEPEQLLETVHEGFLERLARQRQEMEERNAARVQQRLVSLESTHRSRLRKKQGLLDRAQRRGQDPRYIRMLEGTIRNMRAEYEARREAIEGERNLHFSSKLVGCGIVRVEA